ncbi:GGDEF domain-containing protein [Pelomonas sp. SE-A7]|uniref:GGDEF domain-containing protein n=1 Tax=Pelomonas sp. SE-A7 TaxID=3054953 RepID=UPI00259C7148|nr:GGDEF domain-containing protein [Pelomonas sp. SE-A7]MDM4764466.1 GGDEF domain-containing protein [Pelomonas sp. SE-A7]
MPDRLLKQEALFLSTLQAGRTERRLALAVVALSVLLFAIMAPQARTQLQAFWAFIPAYESALIVTDLVTAALLLNQFLSLRSRSLFVLAAAYLFTAQMTVVHALTFPGLFAPTGLLGAGPQTTAWLYMFWHGGFPLFVCAYALLKRQDKIADPRQSAMHRIWPQTLALLAVLAVPVLLLSLLATRWIALLPAIMEGNRYTPAMILVVGAVWCFSMVALVLLWLSRPHSVLDLWLMVVMVAWLIDIALSAVLNQGRFDLGFYAGRVYGLLASSFVLLVLLVESGLLYRQLVQFAGALQRITLLDSLTGVANRRAFDAGLMTEWRRCLRSGHPLSLLMVDIDHFKDYNDRHGHQAGDDCLRSVAQGLQASLQRGSDMLARYGGEEFAVLLPEADADTARRMGERLRAQVAQLATGLQSSREGRAVSVSVGVATLVPTAMPVAQTLEEQLACLIRQADQALYSAKDQGRDRVVQAPLLQSSQ